MSLLPSWTLHGDGKSVSAGGVVAPDERLTWPRTAGIGLQHIVAMFGATFLVPLLTGFPPGNGAGFPCRERSAHGLNRFVWTFSAIHPAVDFVAERIHGHQEI